MPLELDAGTPCIPQLRMLMEASFTPWIYRSRKSAPVLFGCSLAPVQSVGPNIFAFVVCNPLCRPLQVERSVVEGPGKRRGSVASSNSSRRSRDSRLRGVDLAAVAEVADRKAPMRRLAGSYDVGRPTLGNSLGYLLQGAIPQLDRYSPFHRCTKRTQLSAAAFFVSSFPVKSRSLPGNISTVSSRSMSPIREAWDLGCLGAYLPPSYVTSQGTGTCAHMVPLRAGGLLLLAVLMLC